MKSRPETEKDAAREQINNLISDYDVEELPYTKDRRDAAAKEGPLRDEFLLYMMARASTKAEYLKAIEQALQAGTPAKTRGAEMWDRRRAQA